MNSSTIAVRGATGTQGSPVVRHLLSAGHRVRAVARNPRELPAGVEAASADLLDIDALTVAYTGVDAVVLQLPLVFDGTALAQAQSVLAALGKAEVPRVVFNMSGGVPESPIGVPFVDARVLLRTELPNVVATAALVAPAATYAENLIAPWSAPLVAAGEVVYALPAEAPIPWLAADDLAAVISELVTASSPPFVQLVAGPADLTGGQLAAELTVALGRPIRWRTITPGEYGELMHPHVGAEIAAGITSSYEAQASADPAAPGPDPSIIRRGSTTMREWAARQNWPFG